MRLRPRHASPDEPTPMPGVFRADGDPKPYDPDSDEDADVYRRFIFSAQVLGLSLLALGAITLVMFAWLRVFAGH